MELSIFLLTIFMFLNKSCSSLKSLLPTDNDSTKHKVNERAVDIANENFNLRKLTVVLSKDVDDQISDIFLKNYKGSVVVGTSTGGASPRQAVIIVETYYSFMKLSGYLKPDLKGKTLLNSGAKFLVVILSTPSRIGDITKILWSYRVVNVIIMTNKDSNDVDLFTYFPYKNHLNCQNTDPFLMEPFKNLKLNKQFYPDKMSNMNNCPLYISTNKLYHQTTDQKIPLEITKKTVTRLFRDVMNFTPIISTRDYVSIDSDRARNWSDSLNDVIYGIANISTSSIPLGIDKLGLLDYSASYYKERISWIAPPVTIGPVWWRLLSPLTGYLWLNLLFIIFFVTSLPFALKMKVVKRFCYKHFKGINKVRGVIIRIFGVMLGQPIRVVPRRFRDFYILGLWIWFTFVVRSAYQSVLVGALKTDTILGNFDDFIEAVDNGYRFGGRAGVFAYFEHDPMIRDKFEVIPEERFESTFRDVIDGKVKFVIATSLEYAWAYCLAQGLNENECGQVLSDSIMPTPLVIWTKAYSPILRTLSVWLPRFIESGLLDRDAIKKPLTNKFKVTDPTPLTLHQVLSCILCLSIGYAVSGGVLMLEILRNKLNRLPRNGKNGFRFVS